MAKLFRVRRVGTLQYMWIKAESIGDAIREFSNFQGRPVSAVFQRDAYSTSVTIDGTTFSFCETTPRIMCEGHPMIPYVVDNPRHREPDVEPSYRKPTDDERETAAEKRRELEDGR